MCYLVLAGNCLENLGSFWIVFPMPPSIGDISGATLISFAQGAARLSNAPS